MAGTNYYTSSINPNVLIALTNESGFAQYSKLVSGTTLPTDTGLFAKGGELIVPSTGNIFINLANDGITPDWYSVGGTLQAVIHITSAELLNMFTSPVVLVQAPGIGKFIAVQQAVLKYNFNSVPYTQPGNTNIVMGSNNIVQFGNILNLGANTIRQGSPSSVILTENAALTLTNTIGNLTNGDGTVDLYVYYDIRSF